MWHAALSADRPHALQQANYALKDFESLPTCDTSNPSAGWFPAPSVDGLKRPVILFSLERCCASAGRPTHTSEKSLMKEPYVISNWIFSPVSLWRNWLSSHARLRSHLLVMTLALAYKICLLCSGQNARKLHGPDFAMRTGWLRYYSLIKAHQRSLPSLKMCPFWLLHPLWWMNEWMKLYESIDLSKRQSVSVLQDGSGTYWCTSRAGVAIIFLYCSVFIRGLVQGAFHLRLPWQRSSWRFWKMLGQRFVVMMLECVGQRSRKLVSA